mmetsp:Transcript_47064/g.131235  ORF Transcript_47064/g.131235 Transcript_47064/m.131235 type:complete len:264 (+) Transcript_47064:438-1229(+)
MELLNDRVLVVLHHCNAVVGSSLHMLVLRDQGIHHGLRLPRMLVDLFVHALHQLLCFHLDVHGLLRDQVVHLRLLRLQRLLDHFRQGFSGASLLCKLVAQALDLAVHPSGLASSIQDLRVQLGYRAFHHVVEGFSQLGRLVAAVEQFVLADEGVRLDGAYVPHQGVVARGHRRLGLFDQALALGVQLVHPSASLPEAGVNPLCVELVIVPKCLEGVFLFRNMALQLLLQHVVLDDALVEVHLKPRHLVVQGRVPCPDILELVA